MNPQLHILLIDDDEDEYTLLNGMVRRLPGTDAKHVLDWAGSLKQALAIIQSAPPYDLYLIDWYLGEHNGLQVIRALQEHGISGPFIILTGQGSYEGDLEAMRHGAADYLIKDQITEYILERSIRYSLAQHGHQAELERRVQQRTAELERVNDTLAETVDSLRDSEQRFRSLSETTSAAIFILEDHKIRYANPAAYFVTGYTQQELVQMELWQIAHPAYQTALKSERFEARWAEHVPARYEIKIIHRSGEERWLDITAGLMQNGTQEITLLTAFDITERDRAERALQQSKEELEQRVRDRTAAFQSTNRRLQMVLRVMPVGIALANESGDVLQVNQALWEVIGQANLNVPAPFTKFHSVPAWWTESGQQVGAADWPLARAITEGYTTTARMIDVQTPQGERKTLLCSAAPIVSAAGVATGAVATYQDMTGQRSLERQVRAALANAHQRAEELDGLHRATSALLTTLDLDQLFHQILAAAQSAIPAAHNSLLFLFGTDNPNQLILRAALGPIGDCMQVGKAYSGGILAEVANQSQPLCIDQYQGSHSELDACLGTLPQSIVATPLHLNDRTLGVLLLSADETYAFTESNLRLLVSFAATTTAALQNALLHAEVIEMAMVDPLTGKYNRRAFFELGQREMDRCRMKGQPFSALMLDMDNFKEINDSYGHAVGDDILRVLAERCRQNFRDGDLLGRYGGDEFAILLPRADLDLARQVSQRLFSQTALTPYATAAGDVSVSLSIGVAQASSQHTDLAALLNDADRALYSAKQRGKSRVQAFRKKTRPLHGEGAL